LYENYIKKVSIYAALQPKIKQEL